MNIDLWSTIGVYYTNFTPDDYCLNLTCPYFYSHIQGSVYFAFIFTCFNFLSGNSFFQPISLDFTQCFNILLTKLLNSDIIHIINIPQLHKSWRAIVILIISQLYGVSKSPFLTKPNVLIVLLDYIDLFDSEWQHETNISGGATMAFTILYCCISFKHSYSTIITTLAYFAQVCLLCQHIIFYSLLFPSYYSNNFAGKIDASSPY